MPHAPLPALVAALSESTKGQFLNHHRQRPEMDPRATRARRTARQSAAAAATTVPPPRSCPGCSGRRGGVHARSTQGQHVCPPSRESVRNTGSQVNTVAADESDIRPDPVQDRTRKRVHQTVKSPPEGAARDDHRDAWDSRLKFQSNVEGVSSRLRAGSEAAELRCTTELCGAM